MTPELNVLYEFGGFILNPKSGSLSHYGQPVELPGKCFDLLLYFVQSGNALVPTEQLIDAVWGQTPTNDRNVTNHIVRIRKALGDDWLRPTYIRTISGGRGYRFIAPVKPVSALNNQSETSEPSIETLATGHQYQIESHIFVPVYVGPDLLREINAPAKASPWVSYKEFNIENGRLCVLPSGVGVWHLESTNSFTRLTDVAASRKELYERIFQNKHSLSRYMRGLIGKSSWSEHTVFKTVYGKLGYAYSVMILQEPRWKGLERPRKILEILACTKPLEPKGDSNRERDRLRQLERQFLEHGFKASDMGEFGLSGEDLGFASWEGLSYYNLARNDKTTIHNIIEFQIAVHSLWWLSKCLSDIWLSNPAPASKQLAKYLPELKRQYLVIKNIEAKESTSQRTMIEAVLAVNRLGQIVEETLELHK